jgi:hypothetical protein
MKHLAFIVLFLTAAATAQQRISGTILNDNTLLPVPGATIINLNTVRGAISDDKGQFGIDASVNDTLHISLIGYATLKVRVTNDWIKSKSTKILMTEKARSTPNISLSARITAMPLPGSTKATKQASIRRAHSGKS